MDLSDRIAIETGICNKDSFKKIARLLRRHPTTIAHEVEENRTFIRGNYPNGKDCRYVRTRNIHHLCEDQECDKNCCRCWKVNCAEKCPAYVSAACHKFERPPYVCNSCPDKKLCNKDKYIYSAKHADAAVTRRRSESRQGIRVSEEQMADMNSLITQLVKKGQPLAHIYAEHKEEIPGSRSGRCITILMQEKWQLKALTCAEKQVTGPARKKPQNPWDLRIWTSEKTAPMPTLKTI